MAEQKAAVPVSSGQKTWNALKPFVFGGLSGMAATCCIQPIDIVKVRIQNLGEGGAKIDTKNPFVIGARIAKNEGVTKLWTGLSAGLLRQATYTTARLGIFRTISDKFADKDGKTTFANKVIAGALAGGIGSVFGTPFDCALIRMQSDSQLPVEKRRNYRGAFHALSRMIKEEGVSGLFRGNSSVVVRAIFLNIGMLATYDEARDRLTFIENKAVRDTTARVMSGVAAAFMSLPFDFLKTRVQKQVPGPDGQLPYKNMLDCARQVLTKEGPFAFYRGFSTYCVRIAPHAIITLWALDVLNAWEKKFFGRKA